MCFVIWARVDTKFLNSSHHVLSVDDWPGDATFFLWGQPLKIIRKYSVKKGPAPWILFLTPAPWPLEVTFFVGEGGSLNVPIEHHPTIRYMVYNGYYKVMSNIPKMGHLPTPGRAVNICVCTLLQSHVKNHTPSINHGTFFPGVWHLDMF